MRVHLITYSHSTGFPQRRVYRVSIGESGAQNAAHRFLERFGGYSITELGYIKFIII